MDNTNKIETIGFSRSKIAQAAMLTLAALVICRGPLLGDSLVIGISFITYMLSKNTLNLYLMVPAAAGMVPYISRGWDPWPYLAATLVCGLVFVAVRRMSLELWQRGLIAAAASIVSMTICRLALGTVYMTSPKDLLIEGALIFAGVYIFDAFFALVQRADAKIPAAALSMTALTSVWLMVLNGIGLDFLLWMSLVFLTLWALVCLDTGQALFVAVSGSGVLALMGEDQWGIMATLVLGILAASFAKGQSALLQGIIFCAACWLCGYIESGVILGMDKYCLFLPAVLFMVVYWRLGTGMKQLISLFAGGSETTDEGFDPYADEVLKEKASQMSDLTELYSTYLDSRSMLANQFNITRQIIDDIRWQMSRQGRRAARRENEKISIDIAISQCAATGAINGDCCGWQDIGDGKVAMVVSDGMGKGKKAAAESLMVTRTIMSLLKSGVTTDLALKMINTIMLMKDEEDSYATLDMVTVDKKSGRAKFYKIGAAPTLIRRKSNVEEVKLSAVPLGIVNGLKVRYVETTLKKDDWIIMMSDGVSDGGDDNNRTGGNRSRRFLHQIKETAASVRSADPQTMCDLILNKAADSYIGRERDDLTVMVARIL